MSKLSDYRDAERALDKNLQRLESLKNNPELIKELEFEKRLMTLLKRYSKNTEDLLAFVKPVLGASLQAQEQRRPYAKTTSKNNR